MARPSATVRKRRPRAKRAAPDACEPNVTAAEPIEIESAPEPTASVDEQDIAAAEPVAAFQEPVMSAAEPVVTVPEPVAPEPIMAAQEPVMPEDKPLTLVCGPAMPADEPAMPIPVRIKTPAECKARLDRITRQWCNLAERRLQYYTELYRSGRWRRYYTEERFVVVMNEVARSVANWRALVNRMTPAAAGNDDLRLSA